MRMLKLFDPKAFDTAMLPRPEGREEGGNGGNGDGMMVGDAETDGGGACARVKPPRLPPPAAAWAETALRGTGIGDP